VGAASDPSPKFLLGDKDVVGIVVSPSGRRTPSMLGEIPSEESPFSTVWCAPVSVPSSNFLFLFPRVVGEGCVSGACCCSDTLF